MPTISLTKTKEGNVEIYKDGKQVSTASAASAEGLARRMGGNFIGFAPAGFTGPVKAPGMLQTTTGSRTQEKRDGTALDDRTTAIDTARVEQDAAKLAQDTIDAQTKVEDKVVEDTTQKTDDVVDPFASVRADIDARTEKSKVDIKAANDRLESSKLLLSSSNKALVDSIKKTYENRLAQMEKSNEALFASKTQSGFRSGRARYVQKTQAGILNDEESKGLLRMGQLEGEMLTLLAQAERAKTKGDFELLNQNITALDKIDEDLQDTVQGLQKLAIDAQEESRLRDKLDFEQEQAEIDRGLDKSERSARAVAEGLAGLGTDEEKVAYMEKVAKQFGVDIGVLWSDALTAMDDTTKAEINVENIESQIMKRKKDVEISAFKAETDRRKQEDEKKGDTKSGYTTETENILNNVSTLANVGEKEKEKVKAELQDLGFYEDIPPKWFVDFKNDEAQQTLLPKDIKSAWVSYKDKVLSDEDSI